MIKIKEYTVVEKKTMYKSECTSCGSILETQYKSSALSDVVCDLCGKSGCRDCIKHISASSEDDYSELTLKVCESCDEAFCSGHRLSNRLYKELGKLEIKIHELENDTQQKVLEHERNRVESCTRFNDVEFGKDCNNCPDLNCGFNRVNNNDKK